MHLFLYWCRNQCNLHKFTFFSKDFHSVILKISLTIKKIVIWQKIPMMFILLLVLFLIMIIPFLVMTKYVSFTWRIIVLNKKVKKI